MVLLGLLLEHNDGILLNPFTVMSRGNTVCTVYSSSVSLYLSWANMSMLFCYVLCLGFLIGICMNFYASSLNFYCLIAMTLFHKLISTCPSVSGGGFYPVFD